MALQLSDLKAQCNVTAATDDTLLTRLLAAATAHVERLVGFKLDDTTALPGGTPADLELAVLQLAADWYENREASLVGVTAQPIPFGVEQIVNEYRNYTFGLADEVTTDG
jgi:uncharacterized phage protein (predicted DNA packaging)